MIAIILSGLDPGLLGVAVGHDEDVRLVSRIKYRRPRNTNDAGPGLHLDRRADRRPRQQVSLRGRIHQRFCQSCAGIDLRYDARDRAVQRYASVIHW